MKILHISDTHGLHRQLNNMPSADIVVHSGDISHSGTEGEVLDFLNWYIDLPYPHKIFVIGNHDLCLYDAIDMEGLPDNVHFLQDKGITIDKIKFFGLAYNHSENLIPNDVDVLITHEAPSMILDKSSGIHWGNKPLYDRVFEIRPKYHLFGHAHESYATLKQNGIIFSNAALLDEGCNIVNKPKLFIYK